MLRELIRSGLSDTNISSTNAVTRSRTPKLYASIEPTKNISTKRESPLEEIESATPGTLAHLQLARTCQTYHRQRTLLPPCVICSFCPQQFFTWPRQWIDQNLSESALKTFHKSLYINIISPRMHIADGYISKLLKDATGSPKPENWPMTYSAHALTTMDTTKRLPCQDFCATNGASSCLFSLLMILALSM